MTLQEIRKIAQERGLKLDSRKKKQDVVRAIQRDEGNRDCFMSAGVETCDQDCCLWRKDCSK
jgi:hypothetical protein